MKKATSLSMMLGTEGTSCPSTTRIPTDLSLTSFAVMEVDSAVPLPDLLLSGSVCCVVLEANVNGCAMGLAVSASSSGGFGFERFRGPMEWTFQVVDIEIHGKGSASMVIARQG